ncbi:hypothetical protein Vafri_7780 [Volvox africanus]|uniref:Uncharacterized protein n=1 Tax=Volvox africanus TaxID=51714 RepID=A0A8J4B100_9CHLO|nr:hypothetical protein Vafri_7780 [Volvox africanus]
MRISPFDRPFLSAFDQHVAAGPRPGLRYSPAAGCCPAAPYTVTAPCVRRHVAQIWLANATPQLVPAARMNTAPSNSGNGGGAGGGRDAASRSNSWRSSPTQNFLQARRQAGAGRRRIVARGSSSSGGNNSGDSPGSGGSATNLRVAVGIDLGTTTSAIAVAGPDGRPVVVEDEAGRVVIPSVVFVNQDGTVLVGEEAAAAAEKDPANAFYGIKRLMGRTYREALREVDEWDEQTLAQSHRLAATAPEPQSRRFRSYSLVEGPMGAVEVVCPALGRNLTPQEVSAHLLRHLISRVRDFLERQQHQHQQQERAWESGGAAAGGESDEASGSVQVLDAVITVPAHFGLAQRRAVLEAGKAAGLQRITLLQEPIAAAMAYGFGSPHVPYDVLLVFDMGGGTLDLTIVEAFEGIMEVISTSGDNYLGGDDFTAAVADWLVQQQQQLLGQPHQAQHSGHLTMSSAATAAPRPSTSTSDTLSQGALAHTALGPTFSPSSAFPPGPSSTTSDSLTLLRVAEAAKLALSSAVAAGRDGTSVSSISSSSSSGSSSGSSVSVRVRLPMPEDAEAELTLETFEEVVGPLLRRIWWPLEELALATRTQLSGHLKPHLDPRGSGSGSDSSGVSRSGSSRDMEGPGRREGAAAWEFSIFPPSVTGIGTTDKYVAPPRRLSGLVLVGAATRLPVVRDYITEVTGLPVRPGVDPETAVALGAALHAGLMAGSVTQGIEMNDGGYVSGQHGRASGFQVATAALHGRGRDVGEDVEARTGEAGPELVWEP